MPEDAFTSRLQATIAALRYWVPAVSDAARVKEQDANGTWQLAVRPQFRAACPFTLSLSSDRTWGLVINDISYERQPILTLEMFQPLVEAISEGRVIHRRWLSTRTGVETFAETIVELGGGQTWTGEHFTSQLGPAGDGDVICQDHHFLPYRRR